MRLNRIASAVGVLLAVAGCGKDEGSGSFDPRPCTADVQCSDGHRCDDGGLIITTGGAGSGTPNGGHCSPSCDEALCSKVAPRYGCRGGAFGECTELACSRTIGCEQFTASSMYRSQVCDVRSNECFPTDGSCEDDSQCPAWGDSRSESDVYCTGELPRKRCRFTPKHAPSIYGFAEPTITVNRPKIAEIFPSPDEVSFSWTQGTLPANVLVLTSVPTSRDGLGDHAIWGSLLGRGRTSINWKEGLSVENGRWLRETRPPPPGKLLYLVVFGLDGGVVASNSSVIPFAVASGWLNAGEACNATEENPSPCAHPTRVQSCIGQVCRVICSSDLDCEDDTDPTFCARPIAETDYYRVCSLPE
jgi:hypothetical protein